MPDTNDELELTDDELFELMAPVAESHLPTPEERRAIVAKLQPEIQAAASRESFQSSLRPRHIRLPIPDHENQRKKGSS